MFGKIYAWGAAKINELIDSRSVGIIPDDTVEKIPYVDSNKKLGSSTLNTAEKFFANWKYGDQLVIPHINIQDLHDHPDRARLALILGSANQHIGNYNAAQIYISYAKKWGYDKRTIAQFLIEDVCSTLDRARNLSRISKLVRSSATQLKIGSDIDTLEKYSGFRVDSYWENRYQNGGNSGFGSYGRLAEFKSRIINDFITKHNIKRMTEFGCGDGNQLSMFSVANYVGVDISPTVVAICRGKFSNDCSREFFTTSEFMNLRSNSELTISLDVIFHLVEDDVFATYMTMLLDTSDRFCIIYASNSDDRIDPATHVRHRKFSDWITKNRSNWHLIDTVYNDFPHDGSTNPKDLSFSNFYFYERIQ